MKKWMIFLTELTALVLTVCAQAFSAAPPALTASSAQTRGGGTVTVDVTLSDCPNIAAYALRLNFDKTKLTPVSISGSGIVSNLQQSGVDKTALDFVTGSFSGESNRNMNDVDPELADGSISVQNFIYGDVYGDDVINSKDIVRLRQYVAKWSIEITDMELEAADVYKDGVINIKDIVLLQRYIAGWSVALGE